MGCTVTKGSVSKKEAAATAVGTDVDSDIVDNEPSTPVPVYVGTGVSRFSKENRSVLFVFGGPGSQKGLLIEELVHEFEFTSINVEDIVFNYLPNKVANTVENIVEIQELLKRDPSVLTVEWVMNLISAKLSTSMSQRFVIDIVPALNTILKSDSFQKNEHDKELEMFERRHPIMFALDLYVPDEKSLINKRAPGVSIEREPAAKAEKEEEEKKEISPELSAFLKGIDEADKGRLERRLDAYHGCADPFLAHFQKTKRIVRLDIVTSVREHLVKTLRDLLCEFGFTTSSDSIRVVLFASNDEQVAGVDLEYYRLQRVVLSDIVHDRKVNLKSMVRSIRRHINRTAHSMQNFLIILDCLNDTVDPRAKRINFLETRECYLDHYIRLRGEYKPKSRFRKPFLAVTSTNAEVCLFPGSFPVDLCKRIGYTFGEKLNASESGSMLTDTLSESRISHASRLNVGNNYNDRDRTPDPGAPSSPPLQYSKAKKHVSVAKHA